jgi:hypothetical protein
VVRCRLFNEAEERISRVWRGGRRQIANTEHGLLRARRERPPFARSGPITTDRRTLSERDGTASVRLHDPRVKDVRAAIENLSDDALVVIHDIDDDVGREASYCNQSHDGRFGPVIHLVLGEWTRPWNGIRLF